MAHGPKQADIMRLQNVSAVYWKADKFYIVLPARFHREMAGKIISKKQLPFHQLPGCL
jgi:hypothetical protein